MTAAAIAETPDQDRYRRFGEALDRIKASVEARLGEDDVQYVKRMERFSRACEIAGRLLIHFSLDPITFGAGVTALWLHKQLQATEIGHTALHGAYDKLDGAERYRSKTFAWDLPIDEESWRSGHNIKHHGHTNIAGGDPDIHFGPVRLTEHTPHAKKNYWQLPFTLLSIFPNFGFVMNGHFTGLIDVYFGNGRGGMDFLPDRSWATIADAHKRAFRKYIPYYLENYVFWPLLAGPMFPKVLLGNWLAETMRDIYSAATIYCGHVGEHTAAYPEGTRAHGRGEWYAMQAEATNDFEVPWALSVLCGGLDRQIEHHLFPKLPPERLREIAPAVREACREHGVQYQTGSWPRMLGRAFKRIAQLSIKQGPRAAIAEMMQ